MGVERKTIEGNEFGAGAASTERASFLNLPAEFRDPKTAFFRILPVPYSRTNDGAADGPGAILAVSARMERVDAESGIAFYRRGVETLPPLEPAETPSDEAALLERTARELDLFRPDRFPIVLGGDRSITPPLVRVAAERWDELSVLRFGARSAFGDSEDAPGLPGAPDLPERWNRDSDATSARLLDATGSLVQVGVRSLSEGAARLPKRGAIVVDPDALEADFDGCVEKTLFELSRNVYLTFELDALDPSVAPGVATPEPGGLSWRRAVRFVQAIVAGKNVVAADVVGTVPLGGRNVVSEFAAARLVGKILTAVSRKKGLAPLR